MTKLPVTIRPFDLAAASDAEYAALNRHFNLAKAEILPDDPPTPLEEMVARMRNIPPFVSLHPWAGWSVDSEEILASAFVSFLKTEENTHLAQFEISVDPEYRRRGVGRELLRLAAGVARQEGRRLMMTGTNGRVPAGAAFMERIGAERGLEEHTNQLVLADLDPALLGQWQAEGQERAVGFTLGFWDGPYPEDEIGAIAALNEVMNTAPREKLDMEDMHFTPEQLRQMEQMMTAAGTLRWTLYASEGGTGRFAGFTEVTWNPNRPLVVSQGGTGVFPEFRGLGLGRWMKAAMLERVLRDRPEAKFVRTGNADSNVAMLGINQALGFKPYLSHCVWQVETDTVLAYVGHPTPATSRAPSLGGKGG